MLAVECNAEYFPKPVSDQDFMKTGSAFACFLDEHEDLQRAVYETTARPLYSLDVGFGLDSAHSAPRTRHSTFFGS